MSDAADRTHRFFRERIVFLDIETTGLNPETERITEIGAVAVENDCVVDRFHTMVNPGRPIPVIVEQLCGITDADVALAPDVSSCRENLAQFIGHSFVVAHNADFEKGFFRSHDLPEPAGWLDSLTMAALLRPDLAEHNLDALLRETGIRDTELHRGLADAEDTFQVLLQFCRQDRMPSDYWRGIAQFLQPPHRDWNFLFKRLSDTDRTRVPDTSPVADKPVNTERFRRLTVDDFFGPRGLLRRTPGFHDRPQQVEVARQVADTLKTGRVQIIESGTGTGKSLAYLFPAALAALDTGSPVAISTHTRNLQHQLAARELPRLRDVAGVDLRWVVLKGRENYICNERLIYRIRNLELNDSAGTRFMLAVLWGATIHSGSSGDLDHFSNWVMRQADQPSTILAETRHTGQPCSTRCLYQNECRYQQNFRRAFDAHILVINHALALSWPRTYPVVNRMIFDEAHNLEDAATTAFGNSLNRRNLMAFHYMIWHTRRGLLARMKNCEPVMTAISIGGADRSRDQVVTWAGTHEALIRDVTVRLGDRLAAHRFRSRICDDNVEAWQFRRSIGLHRKDTPLQLQADILEIVDRLMDFYRKLRIELEKLAAVCGEMPDELAAEWRSVQGSLESHLAFLRRFCLGSWKTFVYSIEYTSDDRRADFELKEQPVTVAFSLKNLWEQMQSVVLTSATLTVNGKADFFEKRLGLHLMDQARCKPARIVGSPFDYDRRMLAIQPADMPPIDWQTPKPGLMAHRAIIRHVVRYFHGRTLVLMASTARLKILGTWLQDDLERDRLSVLQQGMGNRDRIVNSMRRDTGTVLLGVRSFWEGVDIPGSALQVVTIEKIPFGPFHDPLIVARMAECSRKTVYGGFMFYQLPLALVQLRQGIGRLIRSETDEGVVLFFQPAIKDSYRRQVSDVFPTTLMTGYRWPWVFNRIQQTFPGAGDR